MRKVKFKEGTSWGPLPWPLGAAISRSVGQSASPFILQLSCHLLGRAGRATRGQSQLTLSKRYKTHLGRKRGEGLSSIPPSHRGGGIGPHSQRDPTRRLTDFIGGCSSEPLSSLLQPPDPAARLHRMHPPLPTRDCSQLPRAASARPPASFPHPSNPPKFFLPPPR